MSRAVQGRQWPKNWDVLRIGFASVSLMTPQPLVTSADLATWVDRQQLTPFPDSPSAGRFSGVPPAVIRGRRGTVVIWPRVHRGA